MTKEEQAEAWANENGDVTKHYDWDISKNGFLAGWEACERSKSLKTNSSILTTPQATMTQEKKTETFNLDKILAEVKDKVAKRNGWYDWVDLVHWHQSNELEREVKEVTVAIASVREEFGKLADEINRKDKATSEKELEWCSLLEKRNKEIERLKAENERLKSAIVKAEARANENGDVTKHYDWDISKNGFLAGWEACGRSKWIPVSERLPDIQDGGFVECLVWKSWGMNSALNLARYNPKVKAFLNHNFNHIDGVTHWMPLPEPPQPFKD